MADRPVSASIPCGESRISFRSVLLAIVLVLGTGPGLLPGTQAAVAGEDVAIRVDDLVIDRREFEVIFRDAVRRKYYHGKVPADELDRFRRQVARDIVTQTMVFRDARSRGLEPDRAAIGRSIEVFEARNANRPDWQAGREQTLAALEQRLERQDLLQQMEDNIRALPYPDEPSVERFYLSSPDRFTEPEKIRASVILLTVPPSAGETAWSRAETQARELKDLLDEGADFAHLAASHSGHASGSAGGDLGYLHRGMLEAGVQRAVDALGVGETTRPIRVLEGILLFRLVDIEPARLRPYDEVRDRAAALLYRQMQDQAWQAYLRDLESAAVIHVDENLYVLSDHE